jgi:Phage integrase family/TrwC relaxase
MGAVVTAKSGYDIRYPVRSMGREPERSVGGYYANAAQAGEGPGRWFGRGAEALGLAEGQQIFTDGEVAVYEAVYGQVHPVTGEKLGRAAANAGKAAERRAAYLARRLELEPQATAGRRRELARLAELRALTWDHVDLDGDPHADPPLPPSIMVWRSVRAGGKTKTRKSRRTLKLPQRCVAALIFHRELQERQRQAPGKSWQEHRLVFASARGTARNRNNVLRSFRAIVAKTTLTAGDWTPREMRHSFVSLLSDSGVPVETIAQLVGHAGGSQVTETVYLKQIRPVLLGGADAMDRIFTPAYPTSDP